MEHWEKDETFLARWLSGELSKEELEAFRSSPDFVEFESIIKTSDELKGEDYPEKTEYNKLLQRIQDQKKKPKPKRRIPVWGIYLAAASVAIAFITFVLLRADDKTILFAESETIEYTLPDKSFVEVNLGSKLSFDPSDYAKNRLIELQGEAYFDVKKGATFVVSGPNGQVKVLGTRFNVINAGDSLWVVCYSGKVEVSACEQKSILEPGKQLKFRKGKAHTLRETALSQPLWTDPVIKVDNRSLVDVVREFEEIYQVTVVGELDASLMMNGAYPNNRIEVALQQIFGPFNIQFSYNRASKKVYIE